MNTLLILYLSKICLLLTEHNFPRGYCSQHSVLDLPEKYFLSSLSKKHPFCAVIRWDKCVLASIITCFHAPTLSAEASTVWRRALQSSSHTSLLFTAVSFCLLPSSPPHSVSACVSALPPTALTPTDTQTITYADTSNMLQKEDWKRVLEDQVSHHNSGFLGRQFHFLSAQTNISIPLSFPFSAIAYLIFILFAFFLFVS